MATIKRFENIEIWQLARKLNLEIWLLTDRPQFSRLFSLNEQLRRASLSIMNNISEGFDREGNKEFSNFLSIAKGSAGEIKNMLYALVDVGLITHDEFEELLRKTDCIRFKITRLMRYLIQSDYKGIKYKREHPNKNL